MAEQAAVERVVEVRVLPIEPVTIEASDKAGTFNSVIERMKEVLEPTIKALGRFKDALIPVGNFVWDSLKTSTKKF